MPEVESWDANGVRRLRDRLGLTQAELAERMGTRQQTISEWETGASRPRRMSRRLLQMVADESVPYEAGAHDAAPDRVGTGAAEAGSPGEEPAP